MGNIDRKHTYIVVWSFIKLCNDSPDSPNNGHVSVVIIRLELADVAMIRINGDGVSTARKLCRIILDNLWYADLELPP